MGGCFSTRSSCKLNSVRLVHLSGYVEDFDQPISVNQVTGNSQKHFVCTSIQLLSSSSKPMKGDTELQLGHVYFILPYSILQSDVSPVDLASLAKRLNSIAKNSRKMCCDGKKNNSNEYGSVWSSNYSSLCNSPARVVGGDAEEIGMAFGAKSTCKWKPILDTIREKSFNRRESDVYEN